VEPLLALMPDWRSYLDATEDQVDMAETLALHERTGRPLGDAEFVASLEKLLGRTLAPRKMSGACLEPPASLKKKASGNCPEPFVFNGAPGRIRTHGRRLRRRSL